VIFTLGRSSRQPQWIGLGATMGLLLGFLTIFALMHSGRKRWTEGEPDALPRRAE
jgi:hypothetical protein